MNQNTLIVKLIDFTTSASPYGNIEGKSVYHKLLNYVEAHPRALVLGVSLDGIEATDASFPRESVVSLAKFLRGERGIYLVDLLDRDLIDNWTYAARAKDQPIVIWNDDSFEVIGPEQNPSTRSLVEYVLTKRSVVTSQVAADLGISVQNASTRLKNLVQAGYLLRVEEVADTGGIEFKYCAIK
ncbi:helix-turn-helix transcriptional regulator [Iodobacter sp. HSC-16F04]|uniref:Helix-turn-helix transcriptional regulator n=1 Tax=Iodobacter violaceini TaxID=3044271 RepID=A0ABX0KTY6_9NEIS|nr:helix-turn-helix domain-containing protein [Iodobacter violacea]NHQ87321.1 helix-turn-helix transcriptional regulator [Iodobacter violacea]